MKVGVFAGYELAPGYSWSKNFLVWDLNDFVNMCLAIDAPALSLALQRPHVTNTVKLEEGGIVFPLKEKYDQANTTLEGREEVHRAYFEEPPLEPPTMDGPVAEGSVQGEGGGGPRVAVIPTDVADAGGPRIAGSDVSGGPRVAGSSDVGGPRVAGIKRISDMTSGIRGGWSFLQ